MESSKNDSQKQNKEIAQKMSMCRHKKATLKENQGKLAQWKLPFKQKHLRPVVADL